MKFASKDESLLPTHHTNNSSKSCNSSDYPVPLSLTLRQHPEQHLQPQKAAGSIELIKKRKLPHDLHVRLLHAIAVNRHPESVYDAP